jgi:hypothetical protein
MIDSQIGTARFIRKKFKWPEHNIDKFVRRILHIREMIKIKPADNKILESQIFYIFDKGFTR